VVPDSIEREVVIDAPLEVVWSIVTEPEHVARWLSDSAEIDLRPGGGALFTWDEHGPVRGRVERVEAPRAFAFRWVPQPGGSNEVVEGNSTLVEFHLSAEGDGTRLRVVETGFRRLDGSEEANAAVFESHRMGWGREFTHLLEYVAEGQTQAPR
jgi:uncharacterized protein YndB with AHSA1/START domain